MLLHLTQSLYIFFMKYIYIYTSVFLLYDCKEIKTDFILYQSLFMLIPIMLFNLIIKYNIVMHF